MPSRAYRTAGDDCCARCAAESRLSFERSSPLDSTKTTPLITIGGKGETMSRDTQPGCRAGAPFWSTTFHATMAPLVTLPLVTVNAASEATGPAVGASTHRILPARERARNELGRSRIYRRFVEGRLVVGAAQCRAVQQVYPPILGGCSD